MPNHTKNRVRARKHIAPVNSDYHRTSLNGKWEENNHYWPKQAP